MTGTYWDLVSVVQQHLYRCRFVKFHQHDNLVTDRCKEVVLQNDLKDVLVL